MNYETEVLKDRPAGNVTNFMMQGRYSGIKQKSIATENVLPTHLDRNKRK